MLYALFIIYVINFLNDFYFIEKQHLINIKNSKELKNLLILKQYIIDYKREISIKEIKAYSYVSPYDNAS